MDPKGVIATTEGHKIEVNKILTCDEIRGSSFGTKMEKAKHGVSA